MRIAVVQLAYGDGESLADRTVRVADLVRAQRGHDLVVLPELWSAGGFDYHAWPERAQRLDGPVVTAVAEAARDIGAVVHAGSVIEEPGDDPGPEGRGRWNTSVLLGPDGSRLAHYRKVHRFGFGVGEADEKVVALTLDDDPTEVTPRVLQMLEDLDVPATFYLTGTELEERPELGRAIVEAGHEVGNHTATHRRMVLVGSGTVAEEIERTDAAIRATGYDGEITFRPPYGKKLVTLPR